MPDYSDELFNPTDFEIAVLKRLDRIAELFEKWAQPIHPILNVEAHQVPPIPRIVRGPHSTDIL